ncbi:2-dehydro-3-deoxyphosphooctonate aldolase (KDO 8-P synthase) [Halanaerobium saccharolyticum]|jgi:2-dehydro-3-deoxyphosphooctonate aldolase (KDO 8-P synthase)|uniref:2-dehydro-3-deoxyphosphooctonate aldolase n=1 Tax=Halanaerobium saccharolyticum TaxID=43595 RepID=A0A4R7Z819_9FIRM|nr:3-deoxy-8-phosphooctulonate synthase [Halanaerobium saccharolyticum]RAK11931.1 2-dehydro-3-deoxyphosphooctonate aldolase (KDO 8-P synthase) [Halanaerobium saccharolyticum]TDW07772.1 2-dehydro-3-deoxyphosphooctonate aldolase (KDO 8-P synthase) [Halanaerobium saccharolyticum]TDX64693.1 2-dehydro-3-deoxyphosphooctonate aldolase (KDO 8-P synthase) [Halanaerobium saccharolyticum]
MQKKVKLNDDIIFGDQERPFVLLAGPCAIEEEDRVLRIAEGIKKITEKLGIPYVFKASFDKANRSSIESYRGPGLEAGLRILEKVKKEFDLAVISDIHLPEQAAAAAEVLDIMQIPAFLSRQTDMLTAAGKTGSIINVKKGQFLAPWDIDQVVNKIESTGNERILLTERGVSFGYNNLVVDMRSLPRMRKTGYPVVFDATHAVQLPGGAGDKSGGEKEYVPYLMRAALAAGIDSLFMEVHDNPAVAKSDGANMIPLEQLEGILKQGLAIDSAMKNCEEINY